MDPTTLLQCFEGTLNHEASIRNSSEEYLKQASAMQGFLGACLDIISLEAVPENVKLSASLYFKNKITYGWNDEYQSRNEMLNNKVDNDEKPVVKALLVKAMLSCSKHSPNSLRILKSALTVIVSDQYPSKLWADLLPSSTELLTQGDMDSAYVGLICLAEVFRTYRWKENDARQDLEGLVLQYFPSLLQFAESNLFQDGANMNDPKIGEMVKLILQSYKFVTYYDLPFTLQRADSFIPWANFFVKIIQQPLSQEFLSKTHQNERSNNSWVKCKKWSYANLYRLFQRYASITLTRKFEYEEFRNLYIKQFLPQLLQLLFQQIEEWGQNNLWLSDESIHYILSFIEQTIVQKPTWPLVKDHYPTILQHVIFPLLCPTEETLDTFENDPQEYIHRNLELWDDSYSPDLSAVSLLTTTVNKRSKATLQPTLEFVIRNLQMNATDIQTMPLENAVKIESALRIFSSIVDRLTLKNSPYLNEIEGFLNVYVFSYFTSPHGFLRTRTCEISSKLGMIDFKDETILPKIYHGVLSCLNEESDSLPVKLLAALAIQAFIHNPQFQESLSTIVVPTMQSLLSLSNEFESNDISGVMQDFVEQFAEQLQPFGVELMNTLVQQFLKIAIELHDASNIDPNSIMNGDVPDEGDKQMAAMGILSTTISILLSFETSPEIVKNLEQSFYPAAEFILKNDIEDFYRECCEFVENSTFLLRSVTPISWKILEWIGECNEKEDSMVSFYLEDFMLVINNYLLYGKDELQKNNFYAKILIEIYKKAISNSEENTLDEMNVIFDFSQKMVLTFDTSLSDILRQQFLEDATNSIIVERLNIKKQVVFGVTSFNVIVANLVITPEVTLQFLKHKNILEYFFEIWLTFYIPNYKRVYDIKLSVLALLSIVTKMNSDSLINLGLQNVFSKMGSLLIQLFAKYPSALKSLEEKRKEFTSDSFNASEFADWGEDFAADGNEDDEDDAVINEYMSQLKSGGMNFVSEDGFDDDGFDDLEEDPLVGSILDPINLYDSFKHSISSLQQTDESKYNAFVQTLSTDDQSSMTQLLAL
ncbi:hypothetical protein TPHA_0L00260 [Tetrapisispora phaffii CBS 4417]|uniref:Importin N-terminal domain-containing protein n=1 Tax=Tetrapisispora phaffii (strain ATCC 24235 / CBS 4417 / NBRC 1672 / NRRL Y-8282 / UCD 70-5) TaxID=1071381 RepID=G8BZQ5_TETPH|nr:hypothetical protein TPHA_0L00260 [Tetrapisispora phaffii CBS 4417]CCE65383.1 hypothetical protein TPHA_0L00260 [Tetrapisispora phaffii CBS 4417]